MLSRVARRIGGEPVRLAPGHAERGRARRRCPARTARRRAATGPAPPPPHPPARPPPAPPRRPLVPGPAPAPPLDPRRRRRRSAGRSAADPASGSGTPGAGRPAADAPGAGAPGTGAVCRPQTGVARDGSGSGRPGSGPPRAAGAAWTPQPTAGVGARTVCWGARSATAARSVPAGSRAAGAGVRASSRVSSARAAAVVGTRPACRSGVGRRPADSSRSAPGTGGQSTTRFPRVTGSAAAGSSVSTTVVRAVTRSGSRCCRGPGSGTGGAGEPRPVRSTTRSAWAASRAISSGTGPPVSTSTTGAGVPTSSAVTSTVAPGSRSAATQLGRQVGGCCRRVHQIGVGVPLPAAPHDQRLRRVPARVDLALDRGAHAARRQREPDPLAQQRQLPRQRAGRHGQDAGRPRGDRGRGGQLQRLVVPPGHRRVAGRGQPHRPHAGAPTRDVARSRSSRLALAATTRDAQVEPSPRASASESGPAGSSAQPSSAYTLDQPLEVLDRRLRCRGELAVDRGGRVPRPHVDHGVQGRARCTEPEHRAQHLRVGAEDPVQQRTPRHHDRDLRTPPPQRLGWALRRRRHEHHPELPLPRRRDRPVQPGGLRVQADDQRVRPPLGPAHGVPAVAAADVDQHRTGRGDRLDQPLRRHRHRPIVRPVTISRVGGSCSGPPTGRGCAAGRALRSSRAGRRRRSPGRAGDGRPERRGTCPGQPTPATISRRRAAFASVQSAGCRTVGPGVDVLGGVLVPVPARHPGGERQVGGDLPEGDERDPAHRRRARRGPGGSRSQSGSVSSSAGLHQTIGSDGCCR